MNSIIKLTGPDFERYALGRKVNNVEAYTGAVQQRTGLDAEVVANGISNAQASAFLRKMEAAGHDVSWTA